MNTVRWEKSEESSSTVSQTDEVAELNTQVALLEMRVESLINWVKRLDAVILNILSQQHSRLNK